MIKMKERKKNDQSGAVLLEWLVIIPILIFLLMVTFEIAKAISEYKTIVTQVKTAARYLSMVEPGTGQSEARCIVKTGFPNSTCSSEYILQGFSDSRFTVEIKDASNRGDHRAQNTSALIGQNATSINLVTVTAQGYKYQLTFGGVLSGIFYNNIEIDFGPVSLTMRQPT